jgi:hypothetical protein
MAGHVPVQTLLLLARVRFTKLAEQAIASRCLFDLDNVINHVRLQIIRSLSGSLSKAERKALVAFQTVVQEHVHTTLALKEAPDENARRRFWEDEMRFYEVRAGVFVCQCAGKSVNIGELDAAEDTVLVSTDITRKVRKAYVEAMCGGSGVLRVGGVAGTGKTETVKDIANMLGLRSLVLNGSAELPSDEAYWRGVATKGSVIIIDEANRAQRAAIETAVRCAREASVPLCLTYNPKKSEVRTDIDEVVGSQSVFVETLLPDRSLIASNMLGCNGIEEADDLGQRLNSFFDSMQAGCTKQCHYDFGLRKLKQVVTQAGRVSREIPGSGERNAVTSAVQMSLAPGLSIVDEPVLLRNLFDHFGQNGFTLLPPTPSDFWGATAAKIERAMGNRHGGLCFPVMPSEENFILAVAEEEAKKMGATVSCMEGTMAGLSLAELYGSFAPNGVWNDGQFTRMLRQLVSADCPGWLVVFCGNISAEDYPLQFGDLHTLLDDNKALHLANGESIHLRPGDKILFCAPNVAHASPATISRLGIANLDAHHLHRL